MSANVASAPGLGTEDQFAKEQLALRLLASPQVQQELVELKRFYREHAFGQTPSGAATLEDAADGWAMQASQLAANSDVDRPAVMWMTQPAHERDGIQFPRASSAGDNPDFVYRYIPIDGAAKYVIRGRIVKPGPAQQIFELAGVDDGSVVASHVQALALLRSENITFSPDGSFEIIVDSDPANGRLNHLQSRANQRHSELLIRDAIADWKTQNPIALDVTRTGGPEIRPQLTEAELAKNAAAILAENPKFWADWEAKKIFAEPANQLPGLPSVRKADFVFNTGQSPAVSGTIDRTSWGMISIGHFDLGPDEALIITARPGGSGCFGLQLANLWGPAVEYEKRTGSLNEDQSTPNADGTYSHVISVEDPAVHNWLDPSGINTGKFFLRWQAFPEGTDIDALPTVVAPTVTLVKLADLKTALPPETIFVTPAERRAQQDERRASFGRRAQPAQ